MTRTSTRSSYPRGEITASTSYSTIIRCRSWSGRALPEKRKAGVSPANRHADLCASSRTTDDFPFTSTTSGSAKWRTTCCPRAGSGFAAQNFASAGPGTFRLRRFHLDARPIAVEKEFTRLVVLRAGLTRRASAPRRDPLSTGSYEAAAVQLRQALKDRDGTIREHFLLAECYARLSL